MTVNYTLGDPDTPLHALQRAVHDKPDGIFADLSGEKFTFRELDRASTRLAHSLADLGVVKGQTVVSLLETHLDVFTIWFAVNKIGAIWVPLNLSYRHEFLRHQVNDSAAKIVICDNKYLEYISEIAPGLNDVELVLCRDWVDETIEGLRVEPFDRFRGTDETDIPISVVPGDLALLVYTSGTTGPSKGCMLSHNLFCMLGRQHIDAVPQGPNDRTWTCLPLFHMSALNVVMGGLLAQTGVALAARFSLSNFWKEIELTRPTSAILMASIFPLVAKAPDSEEMKRCYGQLQVVQGVPISPEVKRIWMERFGVKSMSTFQYGQTEGCRLSTYNIGDPEPPEGSAGRIASQFEVMIFDDEDRPLADGQIGEIVYRPREPHVMFEGYWRRPEETLKVWRNMWMHTGDLGKLEGPYLYFCDRKKDYLRSRGENISSFEVESTFISHPDVLEVAVHAVGMKAADDEVKITAVMRENCGTTEEDLCRWSIDNLPHFAVPRYVEFRSELPKNPTGKILKYSLRDEGVTAQTWDRESAGIQVRRR